MAAAIAVSCQNVTLISFSFRAWIGLIWEISARNRRQISSFFGARLFCKNIKKSGFNDIYNIKFFQDTYSQNGFFRKCFSHPTRPPVRPPARPSWITGYQTGSCSSISQFKTETKWVVFQYFSIQNWIKIDRFPIFPGSQASNPGQNQIKDARHLKPFK